MMNRAGITPDPASLFAMPAFSATPAARNARLVVMDGQYLLGFGPRTPQAAAELMASIYPELTAFKAGPGQP
jgi:iron complex transport system substrate-binding protein